MTTTFTASNCETVTKYEDGEISAGTPPIGLKAAGVVAMREFFQHERDQELGRWRSSADPLFVGYALNTGRVKLVNEATGAHEFYSRRQAGTFPTDEFSAIAEEYYDAHPEPKPWHDARPGEVWHVSTVSRTGNAWVLEGGAFMFDDEDFVHQEGVTASHRIWPEPN